MLKESRAWVKSILKDSDNSRKIDFVMNTVETASRLIVQAIITLVPSFFSVDSSKAISLRRFYSPNMSTAQRVAWVDFDEHHCPQP
jgi:hypothetical protein